MRSGVFPESPKTSALSVAWPLPVHAREPKLVASIRAIVSSRPAPRLRTNVAAAFIGPTVWEEDGPIPILKRSRTPIGSTLVAPFPRAERASRSEGESYGIRVVTQALQLLSAILNAPSVA